jgi:hypothetical protein
VLPYAPDATLLAELAVVVSLGWGLPSHPARAADVRHLLLLADPDGARPFGHRAQRLLTMLDEALVQAATDAAEPPTGVSADDATGLRVLLGTLPTYRNELSPIVRRADAAADFLVAKWRDRPPSDPAGTFLRRHQDRALRQVLACLRTTYGQADRPGIRDCDVLVRQRWYDVGPGRQIERMRGRDVVRFREGGLDRYVFTETERDEEGLIDAELRPLAWSGDGAITLDGIDSIETQPGMRAIAFRLPRTYQAGEELTLVWEELLRYGPDAPRWQRYFAAAEMPSDNAEVELTVSFIGDELPTMVWWFTALPEVDVFEVGPMPDQRLRLDSNQRATHRWANFETERRISYGLQWVWRP